VDAALNLLVSYAEELIINQFDLKEELKQGNWKMILK
jgi:hypothetical protein